MREHERDLHIGDIEKRKNFSPHARMQAHVRWSEGQEEDMEEDRKVKCEKEGENVAAMIEGGERSR